MAGPDDWEPPVEERPVKVASAKAKPPSDDDWGPVEPDAPTGPMPGTWEALTQGLGAGVRGSAQSIEALRRHDQIAPEAPERPSPAAAPLKWSDVPSGDILPKVAYQLGESWPTLGAGVAGGVAGTAAAGPVGGLIGGAAGAGVGAAFQAVGPTFGEELRKSPGDPDGAWNRALERATASGAFSALGWGAFPLGGALGPLKKIAFQAFGVQPAVQSAEQVTQNLIQGKSPMEGIGTAYTQGALGTVVPMAGHAAVSRLMAPAARVVPSPAPVDRSALMAIDTRINDLNKQGADLQREVQDAYQKRGSNSPEAALAVYRQQANREAVRQANDDFVNAITPPVPPPTLFDKLPFGAERMRNFVDGFKRTFAPELVRNLALDSEGLFRAYNSAKHQGKDSIYKAMADLRLAFHGRPEADNIEWIKSFTGESTAPIPPDLQPHADILRNLAKWVWETDRAAGATKMGYVQDYLPREWENPNAAQAFFNSRIQQLGPTNFLKGRTLSFLQEGLDAGLKLKTTNPVDLMTNRLLSSVDMRAKVKLLDQLADMGAAARVEHEGQRINYAKAGWQAIKDPTGNEYAIHPDVQPIWKNAVDAKGLWSRDDAIGNAFRKWMFLKNNWVPIKLMLSAFHLLHVAHIHVNDSFARAWSQVRAGNIGSAARSASQALTGLGYFPEAQKAREAWLTPEWAQTPEQKAINQLMIDGGFSPQLSEQLRAQGERQLGEALAEHSPLKIAGYGALRWNPIAVLQRQLFERWIPNLKTAAFLHEAKSLFERRPDIQADDQLRRAALGTIAKSVDNRFGEMFYSNLFWNRTVKDAGIGSFLSLGWNLGFVREFGGGALEPFLNKAIMTPTQEAVNAARNKTSFALFYMTSAMMLNALMTKAMTGDNPEGMDYFLPRFGGNNSDGSPRRLSNMYYTREVPMLKKHIDQQYGNPIAGLGEMLWNKMLLQPVVELATNRDYYGYNIVDPSSPMYQKAYQMGKYILSDQFNPITIMGAKRALKESGKWDEKSPITSYSRILTEPEGQLSLLGFGPAPAYVSKSPAQNRLAFLFSRYVSPMERPMVERKIMEERQDARKALRLAQQKGDEVGMAAASKRLVEAGVSVKGRKILPNTADIYQFQRLPFSVQTQFLQDVSKEDFKRYYPKANARTKADKDIRELAQSYYRQ